MVGVALSGSIYLCDFTGQTVSFPTSSRIPVDVGPPTRTPIIPQPPKSVLTKFFMLRPCSSAEIGS